MNPVPDRRTWQPPPQPLASEGVKLPQHFQDEDEVESFTVWLRHVDAGTIG